MGWVQGRYLRTAVVARTLVEVAAEVEAVVYLMVGTGAAALAAAVAAAVDTANNNTRLGLPRLSEGDRTATMAHGIRGKHEVALVEVGETSRAVQCRLGRPTLPRGGEFLSLKTLSAPPHGRRRLC